MPVFLERFLLPISVALLILVLVTNPMGFDWTQRITAGLAIIFAAYFVAHTIHKQKVPEPTANHTASETSRPPDSSHKPTQPFLPQASADSDATGMASLLLGEVRDNAVKILLLVTIAKTYKSDGVITTQDGTPVNLGGLRHLPGTDFRREVYIAQLPRLAVLGSSPAKELREFYDYVTQIERFAAATDNADTPQMRIGYWEEIFRHAKLADQYLAETKLLDVLSTKAGSTR